MTDEEEQALVAEIREHYYLSWSGGSPPDDDRDVFIDVEYARQVKDERFVYDVLRDWMEELEEQPFETPDWIQEILQKRSNAK